MTSAGFSRRIAADYLREQLQMDGISSSELSAIFKSEPPDLQTFLYDQKYLNHLRPTLPSIDDSGYEFTLSPIQYDFLRTFEQVLYPATYIAMVEEFGPQWAPLPMKNMLVASWGKGSLCPNTLLYSKEDGQLVKLKDFQGGKVASVIPESKKIETHHGTASFKEGEGRMFKVTTRTGRTSVAWEGHRFLTWDKDTYPSGNSVSRWKERGFKWSRLWDMKVGSRIALASHLPEPDNCIEVPDWEVEWIGLMLGDGCMTVSGSGFNCKLAVGNKSPKLRKRAEELIRGSGVHVKIHPDPEYNKVTIVPSVGQTRALNPLKEILAIRGVAGHAAATKAIPKEYYSLNNSQVALLLSRLIDTDGWVSISNTAEVGFGTTSEQLADDVVHLMLRLGVVATKKVKKGKYKGELYYSYQVRVRRNADVHRLLSQLTLLDKDVASEKVLEWLGEGPFKDTYKQGDIYWDQIESIEYSHFGEYWTLSVDGPANYVSNGGVVDHNSGKDTVVRLGFTRVTSLIQHLHSPQSYFNMASFDPIHCLNVAASAPQARRAFFDPMKLLFKTNKYLSDFFYGDDPAEGSNIIKLKNNVWVISGHSQVKTQEGLSLLAAVADEIAAFKVEESSKGDSYDDSSAAAIVSFLRSSASSRFPETYKVAQISFPRYWGDAIEKAVAQGNQSIKDMGEASPWHVSGPYATWEVRPDRTKEHFQAHFDDEPEKASAMYACKPPKSTNVFIRDEASIDSAFSTVREEPISVDYYWGLPSEEEAAEGVAEPVEGWQADFDFHEDFVPIDGAAYCLHSDMAIKGDRAGIAMSHVKSYRTDGEDENPIIKNDFTFTFESDLSDPEHPREVQIRWYAKLIRILLEKGFDIAMATWDGFQSAALIQNLQMSGIDAGLLSLDRNDKVYQNLKDTILDGRLEGYRTDPFIEPLVSQEIKRLRRVGRKVDHPPSFSKDAADALAGSVFNAIEVGGEEIGEMFWGDASDSDTAYPSPIGSSESDVLMGSYDSAVLPSSPYSVYGRSPGHGGSNIGW